ncbi:hypothetical protein B296_00019847 [Ensete ventricosum]|uniref:Uncharacterized protein n=1 Tax=Ensete ventricosum TaxID=4639 RepID=A0A427AEX1_ENSVE|nr:hypothetical protein B296_00019847 [Ensete ventricosum]
MVVLKPIIPSYNISFKMDDSGVHHGILRCLVMTEVTFGARNLSRRVSFPSREVLPHAWLRYIIVPKVVQQNFSAKRALSMLLFRAVAELQGRFYDRGLGLEGCLRVVVDGSNWFGRDWWPKG